jgi:cell division protein FtsI (penicillin-binding protein 3)
VDRIISDNKVIHEYGPEVMHPKILSDQTLSEVRDVLEHIVTRGTGRALYSEHFSIAGKTGTARTEYWMEDWDKDRRYISSFAGYFPADDPKYSCIVVIHKPSTKKGYYGADVTGPVFKRIAQKIYTDSPLRDTIQLPDMPLSELVQQEAQITQWLNETPEGLPDVRGWALMDALAVLENLGLTVEVRGSGSILEQSPEPGTALGQMQKVTLIGS